MADKRGRGFVEQRRQTILNILREKGRVNVADLAEKLGISSLTVRRDLDELESRGQVTRRYGEALLADGAGIQKAADPFEAAKERIGRAAAELVDARGVTVITNSLRGQELPVPEGGMVLVTGGEVRPPRGVLSGEFALSNIRSVSASTCFVGCAGISLTGGVTSTTQQEAIVNALMVERSDRMVLLADSRKLGISAGFGYAGLSHVNLLITDSDATDEDIAVLREAGVHEIRRV